MPQFFPEDAVSGPVVLSNVANGAAFSPTALATATTINSNTLTNPWARGLQVVIDITTFTGTTPTFVLTIQGVDSVSGKVWTILASAALNATGTTIMVLYPGATVAANLALSTALGYQWRLSYTTGGTVTNLTATIAAYPLP